MSNYPKYVPDEFIAMYESEICFGKQLEIAGRLIQDPRMAFIWSPLSQRANTRKSPSIFYYMLVIHIEEIMEGPTGWELLTQKEKERKIKNISNLSTQLMDEIRDTPLDNSIMNYASHNYYIDNFLERNNDEKAKERMKYWLNKFCKNNGAEYISENNIFNEVSGAWSHAGVNGPSISAMLFDLGTKADTFKSVSIIKRKTNAKKTFFVRKVSSFFEEAFNSKLYNITAVISSIFLDEDLSQDEVVSITK